MNKFISSITKLKSNRQAATVQALTAVVAIWSLSRDTGMVLTAIFMPVLSVLLYSFFVFADSREGFHVIGERMEMIFSIFLTATTIWGNYLSHDKYLETITFSDALLLIFEIVALSTVTRGLIRVICHWMTHYAEQEVRLNSPKTLGKRQFFKHFEFTACRAVSAFLASGERHSGER